MAKRISTKSKRIRLYYDTLGNTLNVWFDDPRKEYISEEAGDEVILNKNRGGKVIGFEKLNYAERGHVVRNLPVEAVVS